MTTESLAREFHEAFQLPVEDGIGPVHSDLASLRLRLIKEEFAEVQEELAQIINTGRTGNFDDQQDAIIRLAKELADLKYVIDGTAVSLGINMPAVMQEVHDSNMSKLGEDGKPVYRKDGKVLKGPNYREADVKRVLNTCITVDEIAEEQ